MKLSLAAVALAIGLGAPICALAQTTPSSVKIGTTTLRSPTQAANYFSTATSNGQSLGLPRPDELVELARALKDDPDEIYKFVRNNIEIEWSYGLRKGALGALIDRSGTAFDQANLMVELLREAGFPSAKYVVGTITLSKGKFQDWSGISKAKAACLLLSSGGIPAVINNSTKADCDYPVGDDIDSNGVVMSHVWVTVQINGQTSAFDPAYKPHTFPDGLNPNIASLKSAADLTAGEPLDAAVVNMTSGDEAGVGHWIKSVNATNLNAKLTHYADQLTAHMPATGTIEDIIGGRDIVRFDTPPVLRQSCPPYAADCSTTWTAIPNPYRTTLEVKINKQVANPPSNPVIIDKTLFVDEIYGRKLVVDTNFGPNPADHPYATFRATLQLLDETGHGPDDNIAQYASTEQATARSATVTLAVDHPYPSPDGSGVVGKYMDDTIVKNVTLLVPLVVLNSWGEAGRGLLDKWGSRDDKAAPRHSNPPCETGCVPDYYGSVGDGRRETLAASWIVQSSRAAQIHAQISHSVYDLHHALGVVSGDTLLTSTAPDGSIYIDPSAMTIADSFDRLDVDSAFSLTNIGNGTDAANTVLRRSAVHAIAASSEALQGSVEAQVADLPDTASTATRFEWGNKPPADEDPSGGAARRFYRLTSTLTDTAAGVMLQIQGHDRNYYDSKCPGPNCSDVDGVWSGGSGPEMGVGEADVRWERTRDAINAYLAPSAGFEVVGSQETFLGPGQRASALNKIKIGQGTFYTNAASKQRGGAFVATKYVGTDPVEIAHFTIGVGKGGGGGAQSGHQQQYDPSKAADVLKSRFVDKSKLLGVDLANGFLTYQSPASLTVGNGDFPYSLTANFIWRGGYSPTNLFAPVSHIQPQAPWTTNWNNTLTVSGSGLEAMGESDIRASVGTVAAFLAAQDIYRDATTASRTQREVAAVLANAWWVRQLTGNVVTANVGASTRQFLRLYDGSWIAPGGGAYASLLQQSSDPNKPDRFVYEDKCDGTTPYVLTRGWDYSRLSYVVTNAQGDRQSFSYWQNYYEDGINNCSNLRGFRLDSWSFPQGVTVNLKYATIGGLNHKTDDLIEVNNGPTLGRRIEFTDSGLGGFDNGLGGADARGVTVTTHPDGSVTHTDPDQKDTTFFTSGPAWYQTTWNTLWQVYAADDPSLPTLQYSYDRLRRVRQVYDGVALQDGLRLPYRFYIADNVRGERADPDNESYVVEYDTSRRPIRFTDELGRLTRTGRFDPVTDQQTSPGYDGRGRVLAYTFPEGDAEAYEYDSHNNTSKLTKWAKPGSAEAGQSIVINATWNQTWNKVASIQDPLHTAANPRQTDFVYYNVGDSGGAPSLLKKVTRPAPDPNQPSVRPVYQFTYDSLGKLVDSTDPTNLVTHNAYFANGDLQSTTLDYSTGTGHKNFITQYGSYDAQGDPGRMTDSRGNVTGMVYDKNRRKTIDEHHDGGVSANLIAAEKTIYDAVGRVKEQDAATAFSGTSVTTWTSLKKTTYTRTGKPATETDGDNRTTTYAYDGEDRLILSVDPTRKRTSYVYDPAGQLLQEIRGPGTPGQAIYATYAYTPNGQKDSVTDANANITDYSYDGFDRLSRTRFPKATNGQPNNNDDELLTYDDAGNVQTRQTRADVVIDLDYDNLDRLKLKTVPASGGNPQRITHYHYDLAGRQDHVWDNQTHDLVFNYDTAKRPSSTDIQGPQWTGTRTVGYDHDGNGNRITLTWPATGGAYTVSYDYDALNRMSDVWQGASGSGFKLAHYGYNPLSQRTDLDFAPATGAKVDYTLSTAGDLTGLTHNLAQAPNDATFTYNYDPAHRLSGFTVATSNNAYKPADPFPVAISQTYTPNRLNQYDSSKLGTAPLVTYGYDANGNLTSGAGWTYGYDQENRLVSASTAGTTVAYVYDPLGRRVSRTVNGTAQGYLVDGDDELADYNGSGGLQRRYVPGPAIDQPVAVVDNSGTRSYFHQDRQGSVIAMSDDNGALTEGPYSYDTYGAPSLTSGVAYKYTGRRYDVETGLYYYRARYYSPGLGRFLQTDPVGYDDNINFYAYAGNDPVNGTDPNGQACVIANGFSDYCRRAALYRALDYRLGFATRFYGAASLTVTMLADLALPIGNQAVSASTRQFLSDVSGKLEALNMQTARQIEGGRLGGNNLDARLVHVEQSTVQANLDALRSNDPARYTKTISEINGLLNPSGALGAAATGYGAVAGGGTDRAYQRILNGVRADLGRPIDFGNQSDREAIGNALIRNLRNSGACNVVGSNIKSC